MLPRFYFYLLIILVIFIPSRALRATTATPTPTPSTRTVSLGWNASPSSSVIGYKIFWGTGSGNYQNVRDVKSALTTSLTLSRTTQYYVAVAAYSMTATSAMSNEVIVQP